jgi:HSP20 family protein
VTNLIRQEPFADLHSTMHRLFDEGFSRPWRLIGSESGQPAERAFPVEVSETDEAIDVKASLPGVKPDEVEVSVQNDVLTVRGEHREQTTEDKKDYYRREIRYGSFHRSLALPTRVDADKAEAKFENGILSLHLPKSESIRPKQIKVSGGNDVVSTQ